MAAAADIAVLDGLSLTGLPAPVILRLPVPFSDEELMAFSRQNKPFRIERNAHGELEIMSPVGFEGGQRELFVMRALGNWAEEQGGVCSSSSAGFALPDGSVRSPDACWVSDERYKALAPMERRGYPPVCPNFVIEILSESDRRSELQRKMQLWMDSGAELGWLIDPFAETVSVYRRGVAVETLVAPASVVADGPVAGFVLETNRLWAE